MQKGDQTQLIPLSNIYSGQEPVYVAKNLLPVPAKTAAIAIGPRASLVNIQRTAAEFFAVEIGDCRASLLIGGHLNKAETA